MENNAENTLNGGEGKLKRTVSFWGLVVFGIIMLNPMSIMAYFGYEQMASHGHTTLLYIIATIVVFFTCLSYARMVEVYPNSGSAYTYTTKAVNSKLGFLVGWMMLIDYALAPMYLLQLAGLYLNRTFSTIPQLPWMIIIIVITVVINIVGLKIGERVNGAFTALLLIVLVSFASMAIVHVVKNGTPMGFSSPVFNPEEFTFSGLMVIMPLAILSFMGFDGISTLTEESKTSPKLVGKAMKTAVLIAGGLLIGFGYLCSLLLPAYQGIENPDTVQVDMYGIVGSPQAFTTFLIVIGQVVVLGTTITTVTAASRLLYVMGRDSVLPKKFFGTLSKRFSTPTATILLVSGVCFVGGIVFHWEVISEIVAFGAIFGFICVNISVVNHFFIKLKDRKHVISNLILPAIGIAALGFVLVNSSALMKIVGLIWLALGIIYLAIQYNRSEAFRTSIDKGIDMSEIES